MFQAAGESPVSGDTNLCVTYISRSTEEAFRLSPWRRSVCWLAVASVHHIKWESSNLNLGLWVQNPPCVQYVKNSTVPSDLAIQNSSTSAWRQLPSATSPSSVSFAHPPQILGSFSSFLHQERLAWKSVPGKYHLIMSSSLPYRKKSSSLGKATKATFVYFALWGWKYLVNWSSGSHKYTLLYLVLRVLYPRALIEQQHLIDLRKSNYTHWLCDFSALSALPDLLI